MSDIQTFCDSNGDIVGYALAAHTATIDPVTCAPVFGLQAQYYDTNWVSQGSSLPVGWEKCCCGGGAAETITTLIDNTNGTYTYTSENATQTVIDTNMQTVCVNGAPAQISGGLSAVDQGATFNTATLSLVINNPSVTKTLHGFLTYYGQVSVAGASDCSLEMVVRRGIGVAPVQWSNTDCAIAPGAVLANDTGSIGTFVECVDIPPGGSVTINYNMSVNVLRCGGASNVISDYFPIFWGIV